MSSILTNTSAMVALQTMKSINTNLNRTQQEISTGKTVATGKGQCRGLGNFEGDGIRCPGLQGHL